MTLNWLENLNNALVKKFGKTRGADLSNKFSASFPQNYLAENTNDMPIFDIPHIEDLTTDHPLDLDFYQDESNALHLRLYQLNKPLPLSDVLPMLENMDLRVDVENNYALTLNNQTDVWVSDFGVIYKKGSFDIDAIRDLFKETFIKVYFGIAENDGFNKLVLDASLNWHEVMMLRAYAKYLKQIGFRFSQNYIEKALLSYNKITKHLVDLFKLMHDPKNQKSREKEIPILDQQISKALDAVVSLDEDRILRQLNDVIRATVRTNFFQLDVNNEPKSYLSLKLNSANVPDIPLPIPLYEIFVYSPRFEAIHLRHKKVARGGIRWSNRLEDFRTEILGLMKAQTVKNAIIVPSGAKGGFVLKRPTEHLQRDDLQKEVIACYILFISGLLDITDNIIDKKIVPPKQVVRLDDDDPYLVVAADKGTASFSDIANDISKQYNFWLGDAFASGGSTGYDHKKMGITARGAWESIKRHFLVLDVNVLTQVITVIGIGDMSGDVFGNGALYTDTIKLVAAFDHRHVFIDPDPDPKLSYAERARLFKLPNSSWADYDPNLISKGGGVFSRALKSISLTPEMQKVLGTDETSVTPNDLIHLVLKAPVDLLFNGGIGTYVKASFETNGEVGDRANDYNRINADQLRCKVVGEGGNLGFTQLARIEYSNNGGLINTDFIDNSAGVDCSDHEVNLKILLYAEIAKGNLNLEQRNKLLVSLTDEVAHLVLSDNYNQALVISFSAYSAIKNMGLHISFIRELEKTAGLNRKVDFIPEDKILLERKAEGLGLTRPELAVLLTNTKILLKNEILKTDVPEDNFLKQIVVTAFPESIREKYYESMQHHILHRDIIATQISNYLVNEMGITFVYRSQTETGASIDDVVRAYTVSSSIFQTQEVQKLIESLKFKIALNEQYDMLYNLRSLINLSTRWFLHHPKLLREDLRKIIESYSTQIKRLEKLVPSLMSGYTKNYHHTLAEKFAQAGLPHEIAHRIATYRAMYTSLNIIDVANRHHFDLEKTANVYFLAGEKINLVWFRDHIANDFRDGHWNSLARLTLRDDLDVAQRAVTVAIMKNDAKGMTPEDLVDKWMKENQHQLDRWQRVLNMLYESNNLEYTMLFIAMRELRSIITHN